MMSAAPKGLNVPRNLGEFSERHAEIPENN